MSEKSNPFGISFRRSLSHNNISVKYNFLIIWKALKSAPTEQQMLKYIQQWKRTKYSAVSLF